MKLLNSKTYYLANVYMVTKVSYDSHRILVPTKLDLWKENARLLERADCPGVLVDIDELDEPNISLYGNQIGDLVVFPKEVKQVDFCEFWGRTVQNTSQEQGKVLQKRD